MIMTLHKATKHRNMDNTFMLRDKVINFKDKQHLQRLTYNYFKK